EPRPDPDRATLDLDRDHGPERPGVILGFPGIRGVDLDTVAINLLAKIALSARKPDKDNRKIEVRGRARPIPGQNSQSARIRMNLGTDADLHGEIGDAGRAQISSELDHRHFDCGFVCRSKLRSAERYSGLSGEKLGLRFSRWDARPSFTSGLENPRNSSANEVSKIGPAARSQLLGADLVQRMACGAPSASLAAISSALASSSASSTASEMSPMRSASAPDNGSHSSR